MKLQYWATLPENSEQSRQESASLSKTYQEQAAAFLQLEAPISKGAGECINPQPDTPARETIADTLANPTQVSVDASIARTDLLAQVQSNILALGVDAAESIKAKNSLEKMLAHQLALLHSVSMRTMDKALLQSKGSECVGLMNSCTRMMDTFQRGLLTIQRLRGTGRQTFVVKHVTVESGAQAVIGNVKTQRKGKRGVRNVR